MTPLENIEDDCAMERQQEENIDDFVLLDIPTVSNSQDDDFEMLDGQLLKDLD